MRKPILLLMVVASMLLMAACDNTPATPVPGPTATTVQSTAPTPTTQTTTDINGPAPTATTAAAVPAPTTPAGSGGKLGSTKVGAITSITRPAPKGDLANATLGTAKHESTFESLDARKTPTPESEPTATEAPAPNPVGVPEDWTIVLDTDFSKDDAGSWFTGDEGTFSSSLQDGALVMTAQGTGFYNWSDETSGWADGYVSATVTIDGPGIVGLSARVSKTGGKWSDVVCVINVTGTYACYTEVSGQNERVGNGRSSAIKKTGANDLALMAIGNDYTFIINGKTVKTFTAEGIEDGQWGTYVESGDEEATSGAFSRILFLGPGETPSEPTVTPEPEVTDTPEAEVTDTPEAEVTDTPEAEVTDTPEEAGPTNTPKPAKPTVTPTAGSNGEDVIISTDFSEDPGTWFTGTGDGYSVSVDNGELVVESSNPGGLVGTTAEEALDLTDARIEATFKIEESSTNNIGFVGVSARSQQFDSQGGDWSQIFCGISAQGVFSCDRFSMADSGGVNLKEVLHGELSIIDATAPNTIALTGKGSRWTLEINGVKVGSFTDNSVKKGAWGALVLSGDDTTKGFFSKIEIFQR